MKAIVLFLGLLLLVVLAKADVSHLRLNTGHSEEESLAIRIGNNKKTEIGLGVARNIDFLSKPSSFISPPKTKFSSFSDDLISNDYLPPYVPEYLPPKTTTEKYVKVNLPTFKPDYLPPLLPTTRPTTTEKYVKVASPTYKPDYLPPLLPTTRRPTTEKYYNKGTLQPITFDLPLPTTTPAYLPPKRITTTTTTQKPLILSTIPPQTSFNLVKTQRIDLEEEESILFLSKVLAKPKDDILHLSQLLDTSAKKLTRGIIEESPSTLFLSKLLTKMEESEELFVSTLFRRDSQLQGVFRKELKTEKSTFTALQNLAKIVETGKTYSPPENIYFPPEKTYLPPQKTYLPPQKTYLPSLKEKEAVILPELFHRSQQDDIDDTLLPELFHRSADKSDADELFSLRLLPLSAQEGGSTIVEIVPSIGYELGERRSLFEGPNSYMAPQASIPLQEQAFF